ncbi:GntR family transcriptional regulator [Pseudomonas caricapapayae]|uniref:GntR family transcriptional regulator n=1 Tax=Pseudomonas caricapapayae TaxID=46678 RepID=UPI000EFE5818|nr:GntR family transcriptional regulator [Pseudomonas caricapapayae]
MRSLQPLGKTSREILEEISSYSSAVSGNCHKIIEDKLRAAIIIGRLQPGFSITQQSVANAFGVSRMPVREALRALEVQGYLYGAKQRVYVVAAAPSTQTPAELPVLLRALTEQYESQGDLESKKAFGLQVMSFLDGLGSGQISSIPPSTPMLDSL